METIAIRRVSVWLDSLAPDRGVFAHALDWAGHLNLPLRVFAPWAKTRRVTRSGGDEAIDCDSCAQDLSPTIRACAATCDYSKVPLDATSWCGPMDLGLQEFLNPTELCVFGGALPRHERETLLRSYIHHPETAALVCPQTWQPVTRLLILNQHRDPAKRFLDSVAQVCRCFQVRPVVLTVAYSDAEAKLRQQFAEQMLGDHGLSADYDYVVGSNVLSAVDWAAHWRRCSHVIVEKRRASPWRRWLHRDTIERLLSLSDTLALLALPAEVAPFGADEMTDRDTRPAGGGNGVRRPDRPSSPMMDTINCS